MVLAYIALGANMGDAAATLAWAVQNLSILPATQAGRVSSLYRTAPLDTDDDSKGQLAADRPAAGDDYLNAVLEIQTALSPLDLLDHLQRLEQLAGRKRPYRNAPRTLDLDLLMYGEARIDTERLTVPHPRMGQRAFVLVPLAEIAPHRVDTSQLVAVSHQSICKLETNWPERPAARL